MNSRPPISEEPAQTPEEPPERESAVPELSGAERIFVRLTKWQTVLSLVGVFIAVVALYAALTESAAVRQQTAATVWPFVQLLVEDFESEDESSFTASLSNAGVGPARMRGVQLIINGVAVSDWEHAVKQLGGKTTAQVDRNFVSNRVISPDETVVIISTRDQDLAGRFQAAVSNADTSIIYCYCSIFEECWLADSREDVQNPAPVDECPAFDVLFRN